MNDTRSHGFLEINLFYLLNAVNRIVYFQSKLF